MAKKSNKVAMQWKTIRGVHIDKLAVTCEEWTGKGWTVHSILGPFSDGMVLVLNRFLTL